MTVLNLWMHAPAPGRARAWRGGMAPKLRICGEGGADSRGPVLQAALCGRVGAKNGPRGVRCRTRGRQRRPPEGGSVPARREREARYGFRNRKPGFEPRSVQKACVTATARLVP